MVLPFLRKVFHFFAPPAKWKIPVIIALGVLAGTVAFIFHVSKATSYLSDDPKVCMNCHVMTTAYATWEHSSHAQATVCTDCHVPHDNFVHKYYFKAQDGIRHATIFTARKEPQVIRLKEEGTKVVQQNCIRCHANTVDHVAPYQTNSEKLYEGEQTLCWNCHRSVPHGQVHSLSAVPHARVPQLEDIAPQWFQETFISSKTKEEQKA